MPSPVVENLVKTINQADCEGFAKLYAYCAILNAIVHEDVSAVTFKNALPVRDKLLGKDHFNFGDLRPSIEFKALIDAFDGRSFRYDEVNLATIKGYFWTLLGRGYLDDIAYLVRQINGLVQTMDEPKDENRSIYRALNFHKRDTITSLTGFIDSVDGVFESATDFVKTSSEFIGGALLALTGLVTVLATTLTIGHFLLGGLVILGGAALMFDAFSQFDAREEAINGALNRYQQVQGRFTSSYRYEKRDSNKYQFFSAIEKPLSRALTKSMPLEEVDSPRQAWQS